MKGDFTRDTFDPLNHFSRVLMQQGRVQLDADWNEQVAILLHYLQALATDLIGPHGGPADIVGPAPANQLLKVNCGFEIVTEESIDRLPESDSEKTRLKDLLKQSKPALLLGKGRYYVDGMLCENPNYIAISAQDGYPFPGQSDLSQNGGHLVYLDVWERHLTYMEMEDAQGRVISIRESALNGPDTATRAKVVWQVKVINNQPNAPSQLIPTDKAGVEAMWPNWVAAWQPNNRGWLKARAIKIESSDPADPCTTRPESRYRGAENQLYRVEIHRGGTVKETEGATFKWSRENGSVIFPIHNYAGGSRVPVMNLGRDARLGLLPGDWVEIVDDDYTLQNRAEPLLQVEAIDRDTNIVTLKDASASTVGQNPNKHPFLRRWDQREAENSDPPRDGVAIIEGGNNQNWIELEDGVQIQFQDEPDATYRTGDYWLIPARTATGDVEWPGIVKDPTAQEPHGITHHYAPLWIITVESDGTVKAGKVIDLRRPFKPVWRIP